MNFIVENLGTENRRYDPKLDDLYVEAMKNNSDNFGLPLGKEKDLAAMSPSKCEGVGESSKKKEKIEVIGEIGKEPDELTRKKSNKGQPWSMEEHELFLYGMQKYGCGKWHRICQELLKTRTPTQVASHAQKYFNRPKTPSNRRRSSIHDIRLPNKDAVLNTNITIPLNKYGHFTNCNYTIPNSNYGLSTNSSNVIPTINWGLFASNTNATSNCNYGYFANNLVRGCVSRPIGLSRDICTEPVMFFGGQQQPFDPFYQGSSIFKF